MSTVWTYDDEVDEWETQPIPRAVYSVGKRGGRRFLFSADDQDKVENLLVAGLADLESRIRNENWTGMGVVLLDEHGAELAYRGRNG
jgi:hypothetical protein